MAMQLLLVGDFDHVYECGTLWHIEQVCQQVGILTSRVVANFGTVVRQTKEALSHREFTHVLLLTCSSDMPSSQEDWRILCEAIADAGRTPIGVCCSNTHPSRQNLPKEVKCYTVEYNCTRWAAERLVDVLCESQTDRDSEPAP